MMDLVISRFIGAVDTGARRVFVHRELDDVAVGTALGLSDLGRYTIGATTLLGSGSLTTDEKRVTFRAITGEIEL